MSMSVSSGVGSQDSFPALLGSSGPHCADFEVSKSPAHAALEAFRGRQQRIAQRSAAFQI
eukprot:CAMPEP_0115080700 /NCGR_PEP_ID=MMETSP0227-20121206/18829_1 /TAXON_ID=89957 /ORGANISM="Polarella glacialis, Strain CCMP 1383" /LENGTH=59 /DNA_ID=CAMNT_0002468383 /DNA_START=277 /DNA_END=456 /DNA_ORIENTATION=-